MKNKSRSSPTKITATHWLLHHLESLKKSFSQAIARPTSFAITTLMIAIAFSIPMSMFVLFTSAEQLTKQWDSDKQITFFLKEDVTLAHANKLAVKIADKDEIENAVVLNKEEALADFNQQMGLNSIADNLPTNPLPHLIIANPVPSISDFKTLQALEHELRNIQQVRLIQFDLLWFQRLQAILTVINRIQWIVSFVLLIAIGLIIANVIHWEVASRHAEIEIIKLVGATDAFVRRPFLYSGFWLGFCGSVLALVIVTICSWLIQQSTLKLSALFGSDFQLASLSFTAASWILISASIIGVGSAGIAVSHKLKAYS